MSLDREERSAPPEVDDAETDDEDRGPRIRCPKCRWEPKAGDRWGCLCGHAWNTFDTGGRCPECGERWEHTQCLRCIEWSPHRQWYSRPDDD